MSEYSFAREPMEKVRSLFLTGWKLKFFLLWKLPAAAFAGLRVPELTDDRGVAEVSYGWRTKNPFRSTYMAVLTMAGELASGSMVLMYTHGHKPSVATIITGCEARFLKKATGRTRFVCEEGPRIREALRKTIATGEGVEVACPTTGYNEAGEVVAEFILHWSFKRRG